MNDFSYFETLLSERLRNVIWALVIITVLHIAFILLSIFNVPHPWRKNKKDRREKTIYILVVFAFFSIFTVLFTVQAVQLKLDIKNESYETYFGEVEYEEKYGSRKRGAEYNLIIDPDGERIFTHSEKIEKDEGRYLGCAVYSKRSKILLYYEFFE